MTETCRYIQNDRQVLSQAGGTSLKEIPTDQGSLRKIEANLDSLSNRDKVDQTKIG